MKAISSNSREAWHLCTAFHLLLVAIIMISGDYLLAKSNNDIIMKIDEAEQTREEKLAAYTVTEHYQVFSAGDNQEVGNAVYKVTYIRGKGKTFTLQQAPSSQRAFVKTAIERVIHGEERLSYPPARKRALLTSDNYDMTLIDTGKEPSPSYICNVNRPQRKTIVVAIKPKQPAPDLLEGFLWVDAGTYHVVRVEGRFSESPSFWIGRPTFERDYIDLNGFPVAVSSCQIAQRFSHDKMQITYEHYVLQ